MYSCKRVASAGVRVINSMSHMQTRSSSLTFPANLYFYFPSSAVSLPGILLQEGKPISKHIPGLFTQ